MSTVNPTLLRVGMRGRIDGRSHVVRCRAVLGVRIKGDMYYWNEYILDDGSGVLATLSYEEDDAGCVWRLFSELSPLRALSAREAAEKRVGDKVDLGRGPLRVTMVNRSRVVFVEGESPEWLSVGDEANFLNAEANGRMLVVSWTGEEVEYYYGGTISRRTVAETFGLPRLREGSRTSAALTGSGSGHSDGRAWIGWLVLAAFIGIILAGALLPTGGAGARPSPSEKLPAIEKTIPVSAKGSLANVGAFEIEGCATVEIGEVGARFDRHEYRLRAGSGGHALLLDRISPGSTGWLLLQPIPVPMRWTPVHLASLRLGQRLDWGGIGLGVTNIQASRLLSQAGSPHGFGAIGDQRHGLVAREGHEWLFARWSGSELAVYRGAELSESDLRRALRD